MTLDLRAVEQHLVKAMLGGGSYEQADQDARALLAALRAHRKALWEARPFVIQYGANYEVERIESILATVTDAEHT